MAVLKVSRGLYTVPAVDIVDTLNQGAVVMTQPWTFNSDVTIGSTSADILTVNATATFNEDVTLGSSSADILTVWAVATFNSDVILGTSSGDTVRIAASGGGVGFFGTAPVSKGASWTFTNHVDDRSFNETTVTLGDLAHVVGTIIADLQRFGLF